MSIAAELARPRASTNAAQLSGSVTSSVERDVGVDPLDPPRAADDAHARGPQLPHGRRADAARRARDDAVLPASSGSGA